MPAWSPDGEWIAFLSASTHTLHKIHADGSGLTPLTPGLALDDGFVGTGAWTPDGTRLVTGGKINGPEGLYPIMADGSGSIESIPTTAPLAPGQTYNWVGTVVLSP